MSYIYWYRIVIGYWIIIGYWKYIVIMRWWWHIYAWMVTHICVYRDAYMSRCCRILYLVLRVAHHQEYRYLCNSLRIYAIPFTHICITIYAYAHHHLRIYTSPPTHNTHTCPISNNYRISNNHTMSKIIQYQQIYNINNYTISLNLHYQ